MQKVVSKQFAMLAPHTIQIYKKENGEDEIPWATGVLMQTDDNFYICTAAHVYESVCPTNLCVFIEKDLFVIAGEIKIMQACRIDLFDIDIDIAVCRLCPRLVENLKKQYRFWSMDKIALDHKVVCEERYYVIGFPATRSKVNKKNKTIRIKPFHFITRGCDDVQTYGKVKADCKHHVIVSFHKDKLAKVGQSYKQAAPKPEGNSGSGLWFFDGDKFFLVGILTRYDLINSVFVGTKMEFIIKLIRNNFDDTLPLN